MQMRIIFHHFTHVDTTSVYILIILADKTAKVLE